MMKVNYLVFHEMRHLYQKKTVEAYMINQTLGGKLVPQPESDKKCQLWLEGLKDGVGEVEEDANDFAYYLTNRYPFNHPMMQKGRRLAAMKRKYRICSASAGHIRTGLAPQGRTRRVSNHSPKWFERHDKVPVPGANE
ncbi:MAG: hypothetical protein IIZ39_08200 [Blautia sp.]|nr:hypothetical protein [Blautia sp.]